MAYLKRDQHIKDLFAYAEDNRASIVYMATNSTNGKRYIGLTRLALHKRIGMHKSYAKSGSPSHFHRAVRKYGMDAFDFVVISNCASYVEACSEEQRLIALYMPEYNMSKGGDGPIGLRHTSESRMKMSLAKKGRPGPWTGKKHSPESIAKRTATRALNPVRPWLGKKRPPDTLEKIALKRRKWVICLDDGKRYHGLQAAATAYGIPRCGEISHVCSGRNKSIYGHRFKYEETV